MDVDDETAPPPHRPARAPLDRMSPEYAAQIRADLARWARLAREQGQRPTGVEPPDDPGPRRRPRRPRG